MSVSVDVHLIEINEWIFVVVVVGGVFFSFLFVCLFLLFATLQNYNMKMFKIKHATCAWVYPATCWCVPFYKKQTSNQLRDLK